MKMVHLIIAQTGNGDADTYIFSKKSDAKKMIKKIYEEHGDDVLIDARELPINTKFNG